jgi:hypothetical protein
MRRSSREESPNAMRGITTTPRQTQWRATPATIVVGLVSSGDAGVAGAPYAGRNIPLTTEISTGGGVLMR